MLCSRQPSNTEKKSGQIYRDTYLKLLERKNDEGGKIKILCIDTISIA